VKGDVERTELFCEFGADSGAVDEEYRSTPLGWAARAGNVDMVRFWLRREPASAGASPVQPSWAAPVEWARRRGHADIVALLSPGG
jgi:hypothetical protein